LERAPEARHQAALADRIVLTKTDLADNDAAAQLTERIRDFSAAPIRPALNGVIDPAFVLDEPALSSRAVPEHDHTHAHSHGIETFTLFFDRPLAWPTFEQAMAVLTALRGPDLLRVKGFVAVEGCRGPVVVHAVQHVAHRPVELEDWPDNDRHSRLVFITRNLARERVEALFAAVSLVAAVP
jgi:G3E family GTPase